jgi:hypothetical protein
METRKHQKNKKQNKNNRFRSYDKFNFFNLLILAKEPTSSICFPDKSMDSTTSISTFYKSTQKTKMHKTGLKK